MNNLLTENAAYERVLCGHLQQMVYFLRQIPPDKWDWTFALPAPTPRILATHALQWLVCDRQHLSERDASQHARIPDAPADPDALCDALATETENWRALLRVMTPEDFAAEHSQFNGYPMNGRAFVAHMVQNCIYKNGQLSTLFFGLGLDGDAPYDAPFPNAVYEEVFGDTAFGGVAVKPAV